MTTRVIVDQATAVGQLAAEAVDHILEGKAMLARLGEILYAAIYDAGGGADLAAIEAELGLPAGQGQQAFDLINGARLALDDARIVALREIDQGWSTVTLSRAFCAHGAGAGGCVVGGLPRPRRSSSPASSSPGPSARPGTVSSTA